VSGTGGASAWLGDLEAAFGDVAQTALGKGEMTVTGRTALPRPEYQGAYIGLVSPQGAVQIGVASGEGGCQALARGLLGMDPADPPLPPAEVADAVCEVINIVAGAFKARLRDRVTSMHMGLPTFFRGPAQPTGHTAVDVADIRVGDIPAALILVYPRTHAEE